MAGRGGGGRPRLSVLVKGVFTGEAGCLGELSTARTVIKSTRIAFSSI